MCQQISFIKHQHNLLSGTLVTLIGIANVPDGTFGIVEFVDDLGFVFIETEGNVRNVALSPTEAITHIIKRR